MTDAEITRHACQNVLIEHLADQAHVLVQADLVLVEHSDPRRFLPAVLQGIQPEVGEIRNGLFGREDCKDPAGLLHPIGTLSLNLQHRASLQNPFRILHHARRRGRASACACCNWAIGNWMAGVPPQRI